MTPSEAHDAASAAGLKAICKPIIEAGGTPVDLIIVAESVMVGIAMMVIKLGGDEPVLDLIFERAKERLAELRLKDLEVEGRS